MGTAQPRRMNIISNKMFHKEYKNATKNVRPCLCVFACEEASARSQSQPSTVTDVSVYKLITETRSLYRVINIIPYIYPCVLCWVVVRRTNYVEWKTK